MLCLGCQWSRSLLTMFLNMTLFLHVHYKGPQHTYQYWWMLEGKLLWVFIPWDAALWRNVSLETYVSALKQWKINTTASHLVSLGGNEWEHRNNHLIKAYPSITASHNIAQTNFNSVQKSHNYVNFWDWGKSQKSHISIVETSFNCTHLQCRSWSDITTGLGTSVIPANDLISSMMGVWWPQNSCSDPEHSPSTGVLNL